MADDSDIRSFRDETQDEPAALAQEINESGFFIFAVGKRLTVNLADSFEIVNIFAANTKRLCGFGSR